MSKKQCRPERHATLSASAESIGAVPCEWPSMCFVHNVFLNVKNEFNAVSLT